MVRDTAIPAVGLARQLEVPSCRAALFTVPVPLVDGESVAPVVRVGQAPHATPDVEIARRMGLPEMINAIGVASRVARIGLHFAVSASGYVRVVIRLEVLLHFLVVLDHVFESWMIDTGSYFHANFPIRPRFWELRVVWFDRSKFHRILIPVEPIARIGRLSERTARQQG